MSSSSAVRSNDAGTEQDKASAPATATMMNPHNPEFLTKRPWYLQQEQQQNQQQAATLDHLKKPQSGREAEASALTLTETEDALQLRRQQAFTQRDWEAGQWVEALKRNRTPYQMCQIKAVRHLSTFVELDLQYEDGWNERKVRLPKNHNSNSAAKPRVRRIKQGSRAVTTIVASSSSMPHDSSIAAAIASFDGKRDPYHGYDVQQHNAQLTVKYQQREALRRQLREQQHQQHQQPSNGGDVSTNDNNAQVPSKETEFDDSDVDSDNDGDDDDEDDKEEFVQRDEDAKVMTSRLARQGGVGGAQMKVTARNLRIREDTAKYLRNLDLDSAYYDPKSRSMRDNPLPHIPVQDAEYCGDNFVRISGDAVALAETQLFAWDAGAAVAGGEGDSSQPGAAATVAALHAQANPSQVEYLQTQVKRDQKLQQEQHKRFILQKYGGAEYLDGHDGLAAAAASLVDKEPLSGNAAKVKSPSIRAPTSGSDNLTTNPRDRMLRFGVSTSTQQYNPDGSLLRSTGKQQQHQQRQQQQQPIVSKYEEDVWINGHTAVWGSYFHRGAFRWGYGDDHALLKHAYGTGENGRQANDEAHALQYGTGQAGSAELAQARKAMMHHIATQHQQQQATLSRNHVPAHVHQSQLYGEASATVGHEQHVLDATKIMEARIKTRQQQQEQESGGPKSKRPKYNSLQALDDVNRNMTAEAMEAYRMDKVRQDDPMAAHDSSINKDEFAR